MKTWTIYTIFPDQSENWCADMQRPATTAKKALRNYLREWECHADYIGCMFFVRCDSDERLGKDGRERVAKGNKLLRIRPGTQYVVEEVPPLLAGEGR